MRLHYDDQEGCYLYEIITTDDFKTVYTNITRCVELLNHYDWDDDWESFEEFKIFTNDVTKQEFDTMIKCFNGYNERTFVTFCKEMYGYEMKESKTSISVTIE